MRQPVRRGARRTEYPLLRPMMTGLEHLLSPERHHRVLARHVVVLPVACYNAVMANEIYAAFDTTEGKFKAKLHADKVPKTVDNFVGLAEGAKTGKPFYD